jgi:nitrous oxide reductase accessory protein NosL
MTAGARGVDVRHEPCASPRPSRLVAPSRRAAVAAALVTAFVGSGAFRVLRPAAVAGRPGEPDDVCIVAPPTPWDPASGIGVHAPRPVPADARCPVCGMFPARSPDHAAQAIFDDGDTQFFDSPADLHRWLLDVGRHARGRTAAQVAAQWVRVADDGGWRDARTVVHATGGAWRGPMGPGTMRAFADATAARRFVAERGGTVIETGAPTAALVRALGPSAPHGH